MTVRRASGRLASTHRCALGVSRATEEGWGVLEKACVLARPWWRFLSEARGESMPVTECWERIQSLLCSLPPLLLTPEEAFTESTSEAELV